MITIKKYPNRRLYDTSKSQYINLKSVKHLVVLDQEFKVVDSRTGDDLTKNILLQIISEQENDEQQALLTQPVLKQLIRFYGSDYQTLMRQYLEQSLSAFLERQDALQETMQEIVAAASLDFPSTAQTDVYGSDGDETAYCEEPNEQGGADRS